MQGYVLAAAEGEVDNELWIPKVQSNFKSDSNVLSNIISKCSKVQSSWFGGNSSWHCSEPITSRFNRVDPTFQPYLVWYSFQSRTGLLIFFYGSLTTSRWDYLCYLATFSVFYLSCWCLLSFISEFKYFLIVTFSLLHCSNKVQKAWKFNSFPGFLGLPWDFLSSNIFSKLFPLISSFSMNCSLILSGQI